MNDLEPPQVLSLRVDAVDLPSHGGKMRYTFDFNYRDIPRHLVPMILRDIASQVEEGAVIDT